MSGIVAAHGPFDPAEGQAMLARLRHRGPDGEGTRQVGPSWLGHRHLSIVDPDGEGQPLPNRARDLWLVGDGEIYNHERLRGRLGAHTFRTGSDHEAALRVYEAEGPEGLEALWGMFAIVVAGEDGRFAAIRDPVGINPLYWARRDDTVVFASELKAFDPEWRPYVEAFPLGHCWTPDDGLHEIANLPEVLQPGVTRDAEDGLVAEEPPDHVLDTVRTSLVRAVERSLQADVPVGTFLSGGLDSSIITAIAARSARRRGGKLKTFAVGLSDSDDLAAARLVAEHLGTDHHERIYTTEEIIEWVPEVIRTLESFDPTLVHSAVPNYFVAKRAAEDVKVVLIGEGADELFGGYEHYGEIETSHELQAELLDTIRGLHNSGLQRVDRVTAAHGIEARIPFLDLEVVETAMTLPPAWKLTRDERPEKWLLRKAFEDWLPDEVVWRKKEQFGRGTGAHVVLRDHFGAAVTDEEFAAERDTIDPPLRTREELAYYRLFREHLEGVEAAGLIGRFVEA